MSYTATLLDLELKRGMWRYTILYTDTLTGDTFEKNYKNKSITEKGLRDLARLEVIGLFDNESSDVDIPIGTTIDVTPDPIVEPAPPTQEKIDKTDWFADFNQLKAMLAVSEAIPALLTVQNATAITNLQDNLEATWKNSYLSDIQ